MFRSSAIVHYSVVQNMCRTVQSTRAGQRQKVQGICRSVQDSARQCRARVGQCRTARDSAEHVQVSAGQRKTVQSTCRSVYNSARQCRARAGTSAEQCRSVQDSARQCTTASRCEWVGGRVAAPSFSPPPSNPAGS
jgi:hypothetical protein